MTDPVARLGEDPASLWRAIAERLAAILPRQSFLTWFQPLEPVAFDGRRLTLGVPNRFFADWIESHYRDCIQRAVAEVAGERVELAFTVDASRNGSQLQTRAAEVRTERVKTGKARTADLNPCYRFDNFIEGDCNRFAKAAAQSIANSPGKSNFNPFLIYGGSGLGKTHLIQAIGNAILERGAAKRVLYVTSEQFTNDFVNALQNNRAESFSRLYRNVDVLLLDDVHFFMKKEKTQEEFFHTFNSLHLDGRQLVFSSDRPPRELEGFDERLVSRLQWGLVSELTAPEFETRLAILNHLALDNRIGLPEEVSHLIATHVTQNVRDLHQALNQLLAQSSLMKRNITADLAREVVRGVAGYGQRVSSVERIQDVVAQEFGVSGDLLRSKSRRKDIAHSRHVAMFLCTEYTNLTLIAIGLHFGGRSHATVIHGRNLVRSLLSGNRETAEQIQRLKRKIEVLAL